MIDSFFNKTDLKYTLRLLAKKPGFTLLSVFVLAGGVGLSIFTFTFCYNMLYASVPLPDGGSIVRICSGNNRIGCQNGFKAHEFAELRKDITTLQDISVFTGGRIHVQTADDLNRRMMAFNVEWSLFPLSQTDAQLGRTLQAFDHIPGAEPVTVISNATWQSLFTSDPQIINQTVSIRGTSTRIVGVMPENYGFPSNAQLWLPMSETDLNAIANESLTVSAVARLGPGESISSASSQISALMQRIRQLHPAEANKEYTSIRSRLLDQADTGQVLSLPEASLAGVEALIMTILLNSLAGIVFLLACINVGTLLLARVNDRLKDVSVRVALGAPRTRLMLQTMSESVAISLIGGILALLIAGIGMEILNLFINSIDDAGGMPFWIIYSLNGSTVFAVVIFIGLTLILTSVIPCWRIVNGDFNAVMRDGTRGAVGLHSGRFSKGLVTTAVALIVLLIYFGVLAGGSAIKMKSTLSGVEGDRLLSADISLAQDQYTPDRNLQLYLSLNEQLPQSRFIENTLIHTQLGFQRFVSVDQSNRVRGATHTAILGSIDTFQATLLEGRTLTEADSMNDAPVAMVSLAVAEVLWPDQTAIGKELKIENSPMTRRVVGVVDNVPLSGLFSQQLSLSPDTAAVYVPLSRTDAPAATVLISHTGNANRAMSSTSEGILSFDPELDYSLRNWNDQLSAMFMALNYGIWLVVGCGLFAFLVAISGIYGLTKNDVGLHVQDIGTRRALGASDKLIRKNYLRRGSRQFITGFTIASCVAIPTIYLFLLSVGSSLVQEEVLLILIASILAIGVTVMMAIFFPVREILRLEPSEALRHQ